MRKRGMLQRFALWRWTSAIEPPSSAPSRVEERLGKITHLFANVGLFPGLRPISDQTWEGWKRLLAVNVIGQWYCAKLAIASMLRNARGERPVQRLKACVKLAVSA